MSPINLIACSTTINWTQQELLNNVILDYSLDGGNNWLNIDKGYTGISGINSYSWSVPNIVSSKVRVRVSAADHPQKSDSSKTDVITLRTDTTALTLEYPNGTESFSLSSLQTLLWKTKGSVQHVGVQYSVDAGLNWNSVKDAYGNSLNKITNIGSCYWLVPKNLPISSTCLIKIYDADKPCTVDYSDTYFSTDNNPAITIINPAAGETRYVGKNYSIAWAKANVPTDSVIIDYSSDNGITWTLISLNKGDSCDWVVPNKVSDQGVMRVRALTNFSIRSLVNFKIAPSVNTQVDLLTTDNSWNIYPNPTADFVTIDYPSLNGSVLKVRLLTITGQIIYTETHQQYRGKYNKTINLSDVRPGTYLLQIITDKEVVTKKIIKN